MTRPAPRSTPRAIAALALLMALAVATPGARSAPPEVQIAKRSKRSKGKKGAKADPAQRELLLQRHQAMAKYFELQEGNPELARAEYQAMLELQPEHLGAERALVRLDQSAGQHADALARLEKLSAAHPRDADLAFDLARAHQDQGDADRALAGYRRVVGLDAARAEAHRRIAIILHDKRTAGAAAVDPLLRQALAAYLSHETHRQGLQYVAAERMLVELDGGQLALVIHDARTAYQSAWSDDRMVDINRRMAQARAGFERCVDLAADNQLCHYHLGLIAASVKASEHYDLERARALLSKAPDLPEAQVELAIIARKEGDDQAAKRALERALKVDDRHQRAWLELGVHHKLSGRDGDAADALAKAYRLDPRSSVAARALGELTVLAPEHELVQQSLFFGQIEGDVFSSQKFKSAVAAFEGRFGGVDRGAPEQRVLETVLQRILDAAQVDAGLKFDIAVLDSDVVNAFALPNGNMYFTKGFFRFLRETVPDQPIDAEHATLAHVLAHEVVHVLRRHVVRSMVFKEAVEDAERNMEPGMLVHITRIHEIEADREGMVLAFLAGYHPRGGIAFMEARGKEHEIPTHLDHPTYDERIHYLEEFWSNDVKFAWLSFQFGLQKIDEAEGLGDTDLAATERLYRDALDDLSRFGETLRPTKEVFNNKGVAYARLGILRLTDADNPLLAWNTRFSVERDLALQYVSVRKGSDQRTATTRGAADEDAPYVPIELEHAMKQFKAALRIDPEYDRAKVNLAVCYLAIRQARKAQETLAAIRTHGDAGELANLRGVAEAAAGDLDTAAGHFDSAASGSESAAAATWNRARVHHLRGDAPSARKLYRRYLELEPEGAWARAAKKHLDAL